MSPLNKSIPQAIPAAYPLSIPYDCRLFLDYQDKSGKVIDQSGYNSHGSITGAVPVTGYYGSELYFDGIDDLETHQGDLLGTGDLTVEFLIKPAGWGGGGTGFIISNGKYIININTTGSKISITSNNYVNGANSANNAIELNKWHHVIILRKSDGKASIYVNAKLTGTANQNSGTPVAGTTNTIIGNRVAADKGMNGRMRIFGIYNRIFTLPEIARRNAECAPLVGLVG